MLWVEGGDDECRRGGRLRKGCVNPLGGRSAGGRRAPFQKLGAVKAAALGVRSTNCQGHHAGPRLQ